MSFENGTIAMVNAMTGVQLCHPLHLVSQSNIVSGQINIKGLSFDASGKYIGAINSAGQSAAFEFAYTKINDVVQFREYLQLSTYH